MLVGRGVGFLLILLHTEDMPVAPIGVYGKTKTAVRQNLIEYYIIRTAWLYGRAGKKTLSIL